MKEDDPNDFLPTKEQAMRLIWESVSPKYQTETVALEDALGRVCARDMHALYDKPNAITCRLDGIAVRYRDFEEANGAPDTSSWTCGNQFDYGNTGIAIKPGYDTLIRIENVDFDDEGHLTVKVPPSFEGECTVAAGSTLRAGDTLVHAFERLTPYHLGLLAMGGRTRVDVLRKPVVAIIPSGNELVARGQRLPEGKNIESNSAALAAMVREWGAEPLVWDIVPDDFDLLFAAVNEAAERADIVFLNAGSSKGTDDFARQVLDASGQLLFHRVSYGPGHHTGFCLVGDTPVLSLVGVPVGADFNAAWYGRELINRYLHQPQPKPHMVTATLDSDIVLGTRHSVEMYVRVLVYERDGEIHARTAEEGEGFRFTYVDSNALLRLDPDSSGCKAGEKVEVEMRMPWEATALAPEPFCEKE